MKDQRVHILTSWWCTNDCVFCMDDKTLRNFMSLEKCKQNLLDWLKYSKEVTFTSWEPTIHLKIVEMVKIAKELWYKTIQIISNWRKYKDINFVLELIKAWVTDFIISIHWYNSLLHDSIVRRKWVFNDVLKWLINISKLKKKYNLVFNTNTTVFKQNYKEIEKIVYFLEKFPIDSMVLNTIIPQQEAIKNNKSVLIKYSKLIPEFEKLIKFQNKFNNIYINWLPYCLSNKLKNLIWFREPVEFEQDGIKLARHSDNHELEINWDIKLKMVNWKIKRNECKKCIYLNDCEWIWESYIDIYWWKEFNPITK